MYNRQVNMSNLSGINNQDGGGGSFIQSGKCAANLVFCNKYKGPLLYQRFT